MGTLAYYSVLHLGNNVFKIIRSTNRQTLTANHSSWSGRKVVNHGIERPTPKIENSGTARRHTIYSNRFSSSINTQPTNTTWKRTTGAIYVNQPLICGLHKTKQLIYPNLSKIHLWQRTDHTLFGSNTRMRLIGSPQHTNVRSGNRLHPLRYHILRMWKLQKFLLYHSQCLWRSATKWCELRPLPKQRTVSYQSTLLLQLALFRCGPMCFFRSYKQYGDDWFHGGLKWYRTWNGHVIGLLC